MAGGPSSENGIPTEDQKFSTVLIFGPAGSGKGTIAGILSKAASLRHVSSGDIFRGMSPESAMGQLCRKFTDQGILVPDDVTITVWHHYVTGLMSTNQFYPEQQFMLLDGIPRTLDQAKAIEQYVDTKAVIVLDIENTNELVTRLLRRAKIEGRADDADPKFLEKRINIYREETSKVVDFYPKDVIYRFNADQPPLFVLRDILVDMADVLTCTDRPLAMKS